MGKKKITVVGGPFSQDIDPVLRLVPKGSGKLAEEIALELEKEFMVERLGNFTTAKPCSIAVLADELKSLNTNVVVFLPHLPNVTVEYSPTKIRLPDYEQEGVIKIWPAAKLVASIKKLHPNCLLVPFKLADDNTTTVEIVRWMLKLHAGLAVYSRLGDINNYTIIDALANKIEVTRQGLPKALTEEIRKNLSGIRRGSQQVGQDVPKVPQLEQLVAFSRKMQPAFSQIMEKNVMSGRWPGNISFRCSHGFLSARDSSGFVITKRDVDKTGLTEKDFVQVSLELLDNKLAYSGADNAKPSVDAPVHRLIYKNLSWVKAIVHGHLQVEGNPVFEGQITRWPCGAENEADEIIRVAPKDALPLWVANINGHGFIALIGDENLEKGLNALSSLNFSSDKS